jgi:hypothetical protein
VSARKRKLAAVGTPGKLKDTKLLMKVGMGPEPAVVRAVRVNEPYFSAPSNICDLSLKSP